MSTTSDDEGSQEDHPQRYDVDDLEIIKTIGESRRYGLVPISVRDYLSKLSKSLAGISH